MEHEKNISEEEKTARIWGGAFVGETACLPGAIWETSLRSH